MIDLLNAISSSDIFFSPMVLSIFGISVLAISAILLYRYPPNWLFRGISSLVIFFARIGLREVTDVKSLNKLIKFTGFQYEPEQDIFYSTMYPWQRSFGYCRLYDEAAAPLGMIIDSEPICFNYKGKKWLIEFWKGQYDLTTGGEVGVYTSRSLSRTDLLSGAFYKCASNSDRLYMSFTLYKNGKKLFTRSGKHWWLTGFVLGEFAEPHELTMHITITLKDYQMRNAFVNALQRVGYSNEELHINGNSVSLVYDESYGPKPKTRTKATDWIIQRKNEELCNIYRKATRGLVSMPEKLKAVQRNSPELLEEIVGLGKNRKVFEKYKEAKKLRKK